jgi:hypothetical protein
MGTLLKILLILLLIGGGTGVYAYTSYIKPMSALQLQPVGVEPVSIEPLVLRVSVDVVNPGSPIKLPGADLNLYMGDSQIGTGKLPSELVETGTTRLHVEITIDKEMSELLALAGGESQLFVDGTLYLDILSFTLRVPIPRVPVPGEMDVSALAGAQAPALTDILPLLLEYRGQKLGDVLASSDFKQKYKERTGEELTEAKKQEILRMLGAESLDKTIEELLAGGLSQ